VAYIVANADEDNGLNIQLCLVSMEGNNVWGEEEEIISGIDEHTKVE
jgi:hypothetical protein